MGRLYGLDALRGIAAFVVMLHHFGPQLANTNLFPAGWLCVDFFFMLSGYVIDRVYQRRFNAGMRFPEFALIRLARLYPTIAIGVAAGAIVALLSGLDTAEIASRFFAQLAFIPLPSPWKAMYVLNGVQWSLTLELLANAAHALLLYRLSNRRLAVLVAASFAFLVLGSYIHGSMVMGDLTTNAWGGLPRVLFAYTAGMLINRLACQKTLPAAQCPAWLPIVLLVGIIIAAGALQRWWWIGSVATLTFPIVIILGINSGLRLTVLATWLGALSYPLYAIHVPVLNFVNTLAIAGPAARMALGMVLASLAALCVHFATTWRRKPRTANER